MNYQLLIEHLKECGTYGFKQEECAAAATAITDLLARAEAAETRVHTLEAVLGMVENIHESYPPDTKFYLYTEKELVKLIEAKKQLEKVRRILSDPLIVCGENNTLRPVKRTSRQDVYTTVLKAQKAAGVMGRWFPKEWEET